ncbi:MAG: hypothetical protein N3A61_08350 [Ignavibacteria bacterium]|nr:hypothetical protein [Ignavibacteria bacterium]
MKEVFRSLLHLYFRLVFKPQFEQLSLNSIFTSSKKILCLLPSDRLSFDQLLSYMVKLMEKYKNTYFLVDQKLIGDLHAANLKNIFLYNESSKNKLGLPKRELINSLHSRSFEVVVNFNLNNLIFYEYLIFRLKPAFRVGFYGKNSDLFYNLQLKLSDKFDIGQSYSSFFKLLSII